MESIEHFGTGAMREDKTGKGRCDLLPMCALIRLSKRFEEGNKDHPERNWEKGIPMHSFLDSALRHLFRYLDGQTDEDHLCAAAWNVMCAMWTEEKHPEMQDIPTRKKAAVVAHTTESSSPDSDPGVCDCYTRDGSGPVCLGTREVDPCNCGGNKALCDFYPEKRGENGES